MSEDAELPPLVTRAKPIPPPLARPGFLKACVLTFGYWIVLIGGMLAVVLLGLGISLALGEKVALNEPQAEGAEPVSKMPPAIRTALVWSFPAGYFFGLVYSMIAIRVIVGRNWMHDIGLARISHYHLLLGLLALPGFVILSDTLARAVQPLDEFVHRVTGIGGLGDSGESLRALFANVHWSVAVFAIGLGPGVVEELWCRGFLGRGLIGRYGWLAGIGLSSAFFGLLHLWPPSYVIVTAAMGACLHFAYVTSRSLWVPIAMHFLNNSFAALASVKVISTEHADVAAAANPLGTVLAATVLMLVCATAMWQARWTWPNEIRGQLVPSESSEVNLRASRPNLLLALSAFAACGLLLWLLLGD